MPPSAFGLRLLGAALVLLSAFGVSVLFTSRQRAEASELEQRRADLARGPRVKLATVETSAASRSVTLTGEARAFAQTTLYAKVSGYLKEIRVDKGDRVKKGQLVATLESPDAEQQVAAARADLALKRELAQRHETLAKQKIVSQQEADQSAAAVKLAEAALSRAEVLERYARIYAPFDGVITGRYADPGALLPAATGSTTSAQPLVDVADMDRLRISVWLGQDDAAAVEEGDAVSIAVPGKPEPIQARVSRLSHVLEPRTRTMLCEVDIDNREARVYPGTFVQVSLTLKARPYPVIPAEALITKGGALYVAVVREKTVHLTPVKVGDADGKTVQVLSGVSPGEKVAVNAGEEVVDGMTVDPVEEPRGAKG